MERFNNMYIPRHDSSKRKSPFNWGFLILLVLIFLTLTGVIFKWKQISFYFSGNSKLKISRIEEKIFESMKKNKIPSNLISEYKSMSNLYIKAAPTDASANFYLAKSFYYELFNEIRLENSDIIKLNTYAAELSILTTLKAKDNFENMYKTALRANAFNDNFTETEQNKILIYFYEVFSLKKNKIDLLKDLNQLDHTKLPVDLKKIFLALNFIAIPLSGNSELFEKILLINDVYIFNENEIAFLKAVTLYSNKDYLKALELFRISKSELNPLSIEATIYEADIFYKQNLHEKSISILENLYTETGSSNEKILSHVREIIASKPGLKTKLEL